ncbi:hypothetical protein ACF0H5_005988 [Mactra antiquata]
MIEWPRSKRKKGSTVERQFQRPFAIIVNKLGLLGRNYFVRFVAYLLLCIPCCFTLATLMGGLCLVITGAIYLLAAMKGEEWSATGLEKPDSSNKKRVKSLHPPKKPPPRQTGQSEEPAVNTDGITMEIVEEASQPAQASARPRPVPTAKPSLTPQTASTNAAISRPTRPPPASSQNPASRPTRPPPRPSANAAEGIQDTS